MMQDQPLTSSPLSNDDSLLLAVFVAALVHVGILLGINFKAPQAPKANKSIEITLSHAPLKKAPSQAKYLASEHQLGAGDSTQKPEPVKQSLPTPPIEASAPARVEPTKQPAREAQNPTPRKLLTQAKAPVKVAAAVETAEEPVAETITEHPKLTAEALQQQIAQLGEQIRNTRQSAEDSKIKFVSSVSTHKYLAAQYVKDWEDKVERTGNLNYPAAAKKPGVSQSLTMDVGINADGSIYSMRVVRTSGNLALDEAAKRIVKMSAPFAALPTELLKEVNVLVITRVWKFSDETGMTAR
ncbi:TonB family protein [Methylomonas sp. SURF-2]|uniref:TonB family protein n=1 Tax=Methylomonas subterranea TaxID=2952225 RepID=A0ABT1TD93_9GAMM|nr:TonB family protein [Methylomonas sp. SURF-2]MCQ8103418.1 TonB family protein [Methylomonas sp. SURF-2]